MQRVLIVGNSGAGKSTLARKLGEKLGLQVVHLDLLYWKPNWVESEESEFRARVAAALGGPAWICDGNFGSNWDQRMPLADTIVWLDLPRLRCLLRAIARALSGAARPDMAPGCNEKIDLEFYRFIWSYEAKVKPRLQAALARYGSHARLLHLRSDGEIARFLADAA